MPPQPLSGVRVLVGRARHQAGSLASALHALGADVVEVPFIEIRKPRSYKTLDAALKKLSTYDWLILTSVNGVEALWDRLKKLRLTSRELRNVQIAAIGPATKRAVENYGLKVAVVPKEYVAESVVERLSTKVEGKRVLLARARVARDVIPRELRKLGAHVDVVEAYETVVPKSSRVRLRAIMRDPARRPDVITFTSSSTVRNFAVLLDPKWRGHPRLQKAGVVLLEGARFASIGPVTSATLRELGLPVDVEAKKYTIPGLIAAIAKLSRSRGSPTSNTH
jgi:uroporphyrinogen-III synthase